MEKKPFIHLFETSEGKYLYDVNTYKILKIPQYLFDYLKGNKLSESEAANAKRQVDFLKENGYLKTSRVKYTEHPVTEFVPFYIQTKLNYLILQVTQNCNLRCDYCVYSGKYYTRTHSNKRMSFEIAKKGIDYLIEHSQETWKLYLGFYGGEPLLESELIKKCIDYAGSHAVGKQIEYSITTNGTLLNDANVELLVKNNFRVTVSLDGPKEIHDISRRFANNDAGSFDIIKNNLYKIKEQYPEFYKDNISFNTVFTGKDDVSLISNYFSGEELFKDSLFSSSIVSSEFSKNPSVFEEQFREEYKYETFKLLLSNIGILNTDDVSVVVKKNYETMLDLFENQKRSVQNELTEKDHHGGPCIPGVLRLFLNANGDFFPCEKVCETSDFAKIGNINVGLDIERIKRVLNIEKFTQEKCHNCWAYSLCRTCVGCVTDNEEDIKHTILKRCPQVLNSCEELLKDYCALIDWGYDFEYGPVIHNIEQYV